MKLATWTKLAIVAAGGYVAYKYLSAPGKVAAGPAVSFSPMRVGMATKPNFSALFAASKSGLLQPASFVKQARVPGLTSATAAQSAQAEYDQIMGNRALKSGALY